MTRPLRSYHVYAYAKDHFFAPHARRLLKNTFRARSAGEALMLMFGFARDRGYDYSTLTYGVIRAGTRVKAKALRGTHKGVYTHMVTSFYIKERGFNPIRFLAEADREWDRAEGIA